MGPLVTVMQTLTPTAHALSIADGRVSAVTRQRIHDSVPDNTRRAYARIWDGRSHPDREPERPGGFVGWCVEHGRTAVPATAETLAEYVSHLCDKGLAPATIEQAIAAVRTRHRLNGHGRHFPDAEHALRVLKTHRRDRAAAGLSGQRQSLPIVVDALRKMVDTIDQDTVLGARDHALLLLGVVTFGRRSEIATLMWDDLAEAQEGMTVRIRMSKTDQEARGETIPVLYGAFPGTDPVRVLIRWRKVLGAQGLVSGRLLRSVDRHGKLGNGIAANAVNDIVKTRARLAGLGEGYTAHSLRAGAATIAYMNGAPISTICRLGRWEPGSRVVLGYIRSVDQWKDHPFRGVL